MSESALVAYDAKRVTRALDEWLREEAANSHDGRNRVLDEWPRLARELTFSRRESRSGASAQKGYGHYSRYHSKIELYPDFADNDWYVGTLMHHSLMFVSGGFRMQCALKASSADDYLNMRLNGDRAHDVLMEDVLEATMADVAKEGLFGRQALHHFVKHHKALNNRLFELHNDAYGHERPADGFKYESAPVQAVAEIQEVGVSMAAGHIVMAASLREWDYTSVPFLEPKSITDASEIPEYRLAVHA